MTLAQYRRRFPNIDWSKPSPAMEFALEPEDRARILEPLLRKFPELRAARSSTGLIGRKAMRASAAKAGDRAAHQF
jgi:hypothetical protein